MTEPMTTHDCRNDHHGRACGMTPCDCECHRADAEDGQPARVGEGGRR